jgi:hypothetical protein
MTTLFYQMSVYVLTMIQTCNDKNRSFSLPGKGLFCDNRIFF